MIARDIAMESLANRDVCHTLSRFRRKRKAELLHAALKGLEAAAHAPARPRKEEAAQ